LGCLNYTEHLRWEHHTGVAAAHGLPPPSEGIQRLGMLLTAVGGGVVGYGFPRRAAWLASPTMTGHEREGSGYGPSDFRPRLLLGRGKDVSQTARRDRDRRRRYGRPNGEPH